MSKIFTYEQLEVLVGGVDDLEKQQFADLIQCFPFTSLINVSILDYESVRIHVQLLMKLGKRDLLYKNDQAVASTLEFTLANLLSLENVDADDILSSLLQLLKQIIHSIKTMKEFTQGLMKNRERLLDVITFTTKLKTFTKSHARDCTDVLCVLLMLGGPLPLTTSRNLAEISEIFKGLKAVHELSIISSIVLKKFTLSTEVFNVCIPWLLLYGPSLLEESQEEDDTLLELLKVMNEFYTKYGYLKNRKRQSKTDLFQAFEEYISNVKKNSDRIICLSGKEDLRKECLNLFSFVFSDYGDEEMGVKIKHTVILSKLLELPTDVKQWPHVKSNVFFYVCSFLYTHSRLVWNSSEILQALASLIYSYDRFSIDWPLLKALCYIYPITSADCLNEATILLGDELLTILSGWPHTVHKIQTFHLAQLVWILKGGAHVLKKQVLCEWLKRGADMEAVGKAILQCDARNVLLDILIDPCVDEATKDKATEITHKILDEVLSKRIAMLIPVALRKKAILHRLILSNPGMPDSTEQSLKLCEFMSLILFSIVDEKVLKAACSYCIYLVKNLKRENSVVTLFCQDMDNIKFLTIKVKYVGEETSAEIFRLLKILVLVQKRNHNVMEEKVEGDLSLSLTGPQLKVEKCLDLLQFIVTSENIFIQIHASSVQNTFLNLFSLSQDPKYAVRSFICLKGILKTNNWLAQLYSTCLFIHIQCCLRVDETSGFQFVAFLSTWIHILKGCTIDSIYYVPDKRTISNYIKRVDFLPQTQVDYLLRILSKLKIYPDNPNVKLRTFTHDQLLQLG